MLLFFVAYGLAAAPPDACPTPNDAPAEILDSDAAPDGADYTLTRGDQYICWWVIPEGQRGSIVHRWSLEARFPTRVEALPDGRAVFVMSDFRLQVRYPGDKEYRNLELTLPGNPDVVLGHGRRDWVAVTVPLEAQTDRVLLIDVDRERVVASVALPSAALSVSFLATDDAIYLDGEHALVLSEAGFTSLGQLR